MKHHHGTVGFNVPLDTLSVSSETILLGNHLTGSKNGFLSQPLGWYYQNKYNFN